MATNKSKTDGHLKGAIRDLSQIQRPSGDWAKRDTGSGRFLNVKADKATFKSVSKEK